MDYFKPSESNIRGALEELYSLKSTLKDRSKEEEKKFNNALGYLQLAIKSGCIVNKELCLEVEVALDVLETMKSWSDLFLKRYPTSEYEEQITATSLSEIKTIRLFNECFSNFSTPNIYHTGVLRFIEDEDRWVDYDALHSAFYLNGEYYKPPKVRSLMGGDVLEYEDFVSRVTNNADNQDGTIGSNRICFLNGKIGSGKSALVCKILYDKFSFSSKDYVFRFDIESSWKDAEGFPKNIDYDFFCKFASELSADSRKFASNKDGVDLECGSYANGDDPYVYIYNKVCDFRDNGFKVTFVIDNLDRYSFYYDRYTFFESGLQEHNKSIFQIDELYQSFNRNALSNIGVCVLFVVRDYVLRRLVNNDGLDPDYERNTYNILPVKKEEVISGRISLFTRAINALPDQKLKGMAMSYRDILRLLGVKERLKNQGNTLNDIFEFCHHGHRSMIDFISKIKIDVASKESFSRFFSNRSLPLLLLYLLNAKKRYSQNEKHFPNLFLIDCLAYRGVGSARKFPQAHQPHVHTYWLKIFILIFVKFKSDNKRSVSARDIIRFFSERGNYEPHLIKMCLGSLSSFNEMSCLKIDYMTSSMDVRDCALTLTGRAEKLLNKEDGVPFYMSFPYLQVVVDDHMLWMPAIDDFIYEHGRNYDYLNEDLGKYMENGSVLIEERASSVVYFIEIAKRYLKLECEKNPNVLVEVDGFERYLPDFRKVDRALYNFLLGVNKHMQIDDFVNGRYQQIRNEVSKSKAIEDFFSKLEFGSMKVDY